MDKRLSEKILQHFDFKTMEVLKEYIDDRTNIINKMFLRENSIERIRQYQGMLEELETLIKIRDHSTAIIERDR